MPVIYEERRAAMKRRLRIGIRSRKDSYTAALQALRRVEAGDLTAHEPGLYFESLEDLRKILTAKRLVHCGRSL